MPSTLLRFVQDMNRLGLAYHFKDDDNGYDIYSEGVPVYNVHQNVVWRGWNDEVLAEVMTAASLYKVFG